MGNESINWSTFVHAIRQAESWGSEDIEEKAIGNDSPELSGEAKDLIEWAFFTWQICCLPVLELASIRHDGPDVPFGVQFFRTINSESSDPRDKVFGILGLSSFKEDNFAITPDYNKSVL